MAKETEWILILLKIIRQDLQDRKDSAAFGRKALRRRRKKILIILHARAKL